MPRYADLRGFTVKNFQAVENDREKSFSFYARFSSVAQPSAGSADWATTSVVTVGCVASGPCPERQGFGRGMRR